MTDRPGHAAARSGTATGSDAAPLTVIFTDIEGSTELWDIDDEAMRRAHARHNEILAEAFAAGGGTIVKNRGDGFMAVFEDPIGAVRAAAESQQLLHSQPWDEQLGPLRVRIGLSTGMTEHRDGDYYGTAVNRAARLESAAHGGQVLISEATRALIVDRLPRGYGLLDLGIHRLRGLVRDERIYQLRAPGLAEAFPALRTDSDRGRPLPSFDTGFFGRGAEIAEIATMLERGARLVTLLGPGGIGKTRLAVEVARGVASGFGGGVFFADLAPVAAAEEVGHVFAEAVGAHIEGAAELVDLVADRITRPTLVVVDNFDRVVAAAGLMARLLDACPELSLIVTSRSPLGIAAERLCRISPLQVGGEESDEPGPAVALFLDRAAAQGAELGDADRAAVESICSRLDGLPLAIELVAARTRILGVTDLDRMLAKSLDAIGTGGVDSPERHRTIRNTIDWSLQAVTDQQRALFARLSALPAGATLPMVERVCVPEDPGAMIDDLAALVDNSLVNSVTSLPGGTRFRQLAPLREYGAELLDAAGETAQTLDRLLDHYVASSPEMADALQSSPEGERVIDADHANLLTAMEWSLSSGRIPEMARVLTDIWIYWFNGDRDPPLIRWLHSAAPGADSPHLDWLAGFLGFQSGDFATMADRMAAARESFIAAGEERGEALASMFLATAIEDPAQARPLLDAAQARFEADGDHVASWIAQLFQSVIDFFEGDLETSLRRRLDGLATAAERQYELLIAWMRWNAALSYHGLGRSHEAAELLVDALDYMVSEGYVEGIASCAQSIGVLDVTGGNAARGVTLISGADVQFERIGTSPWVEAIAYNQAAAGEAREALGDEGYDDALQQGAGLELQGLIALATGTLEELIPARDAG